MMQAYFAHLASVVSSFDSIILYKVQSIGPAWLPVAWFISYGLGYEVMLVAFVIALYLLRKHRVAWELLVIAIISLAVTYVLKIYFHAPRPFAIDPAVIKYATDTDYGLPSAHAVMSIIILGWMAIRHPKSHILLWGSLAIVLLIGLSRVYLGVHYPSQVLAGWVVGGLLLYIFYRIDKRLWAPFQKKLR